MRILGSKTILFASLLFVLVVIASGAPIYGQGPISSASDADSDFGPVMRAYLGYLRDEQEVVDDRVSRREITAAYYRRNSNRIRALRQEAIHLVRSSGNDYVPELEAVASDELKTVFENPPRVVNFQTNQIVENKLRFLGLVHVGENFYVFARLDPYEQAELMRKEKVEAPRVLPNETQGVRTPVGQRVGQNPTRPRRVIQR